MPKQFSLPGYGSNQFLFITSLCLYAGMIVILPRYSHEWDSYCWGLWSEQIWNKGLTSVYEVGSPVNYPPLFLYVLKLYSLTVGPHQFFSHTYTLKSLTLAFDFASMLLLIRLIEPERQRLKYFLIGILNIGFIYNTVVWNQVDGIMTFFVFSSFFFAIRKHVVFSVLMMLLALNFKLQSIVFLPIVFMILLPQFKTRNILISTVVCVAVQILILLPFILAGNALNIIPVIFGSIDYYPSLSMNAYNFWQLLFDGNLMFVKDTGYFFFKVTYKQVGLILFGITTSMVLFPLFISSWQAMRQKIIPPVDLKHLLLSITLVSCLFFFFNTQMHERYIHPAILFSTALAFIYKEWVQWLILSITYALSLESICKFLNLNTYDSLLFSPRILAILYALSILLLFRSWWLNKPFKKAI